MIIHLEFGGPFYRYKGFLIEIHRYHGPMRLNRDYSGSKITGPRFWAAYEELAAMTEEERNTYKTEET